MIPSSAAIKAATSLRVLLAALASCAFWVLSVAFSAAFSCFAALLFSIVTAVERPFYAITSAIVSLFIIESPISV